MVHLKKLVCVHTQSSVAQLHPTAIPRTVACQAPPPIAFPRQEYRSGLPFPSPGRKFNPKPGTESVSLVSPVWQVGSLSLSPGKPRVWGRGRIGERDSGGQTANYEVKHKDVIQSTENAVNILQ